ncbi:hypothetical protein DTO96_102177 [Ephemeroptericola cinctiostellae]|uniref:Uncharacterized protein n=1 Tax=Ephemeroptericola cinctiostellae TaxID=2268024 RepID=A0A345DDI5_9BURK|nr:hypothetical protein DTO96_102177 [Ephemeroptericola cinctiostellae]
MSYQKGTQAPAYTLRPHPHNSSLVQKAKMLLVFFQRHNELHRLYPKSYPQHLPSQNSCQMPPSTTGTSTHAVHTSTLESQPAPEVKECQQRATVSSSNAAVRYELIQSQAALILRALCAISPARFDARALRSDPCLIGLVSQEVLPLSLSRCVRLGMKYSSMSLSK